MERFAAAHPRSGELRDAADDSLLSGVPMNWMTRWPGAFPVVFDTAAGGSLTDVDGNAYVDFCLGDTGAMAGHSPAPTVAAASAQMERGITTMLPSEDAGPVGAELGRRFGLRHWQFTLTATDANRFAIRLSSRSSATSGRRCRRRRRRGWSSSTTSPRWSASWRRAMSPASSPSRH